MACGGSSGPIIAGNTTPVLSTSSDRIIGPIPGSPLFHLRQLVILRVARGNISPPAHASPGSSPRPRHRAPSRKAYVLPRQLIPVNGRFYKLKLRRRACAGSGLLCRARCRLSAPALEHIRRSRIVTMRSEYVWAFCNKNRQIAAQDRSTHDEPKLNRRMPSP